MAYFVNDPAVNVTSGYRGGRLSPAGVAGAVAVHAGIIAAVVLLPGVPVVQQTWTTLTTRHIPAPEPKPDDSVPPPPDKARTESTVVPPKRQVIVPTDLRPVEDVPVTPTFPTDLIPIRPEVLPLMEAPLVAASIDPRAAFQPEYPPRMMHMEREGKVTVRVHIGANGRVLSVDLVSTTDDAFWVATRKQALSQWRFRPATRGGAPVESEQQLTVFFKMT